MTASLGSVEVRAVLAPASDAGTVGVGAQEVADRVSRALGDPLLAALPEAFERLAEVDPGAFWVLRDLHVHAALPYPGTDPNAGGAFLDVGDVARLVADALAEGIVAAVRLGPSTEAIRFAGRPAYAAAYLGARTAGITGGWVFAPLSALDALPVPDALVAAARAADVSVAEVALAFAQHPGWQTMTDQATREQAERLVAALRAAVPPGAAASAPAAGVSAGAVWSERLRTPMSASGVLSLVGSAVRARGASLPVLAAALHLVPDDPVGAADRRPPTPSSTPPPGVARRRGAATSTEPTSSAAPGPAGAGIAQNSAAVLSSPGAAAFVVLPDLAELIADTALAGAQPAAAGVRAEVLRAMLGPEVGANDPALSLAAGLSGDDAPSDAELARVRLGALRELAGLLDADQVRGWRHPGDAAWVSRAGPLDAGVQTLAVALLRRFARHLPGFGRSAANYLMPKVLPPGGRWVVHDDLIEVTVPRVPLGVLLALAGLDAFAASVPWLPVPFAVSHEDPAPASWGGP